MKSRNLLEKTAYTIIILLGVGFVLVRGANIIMPVVFAIFFAIFLNPINNFFLKKIKQRWFAILLSFLIIFLPLLIITLLFSMQLVNIVESMPSISSNLKIGVNKALAKLNQLAPLVSIDDGKFISENLNKILEGPFKILSKGVASSTSLLVNMSLTTIYTFFILYYKASFRHFLLHRFRVQSHPEVSDTLDEIQDTVQAYVGGLGIVMLILTVLISLSLYFIGLKYALFWGALAGVLAIIPYIGTIIGGLLPFLYAIATTNTLWQPIAIVVLYLVIQQIEGNFITPKIVGDKVDINPLFAIIALIFFGSIWGVGGIILALPVISIIRIIFERFEATEDYANILSTNIDNKRNHN